MDLQASFVHILFNPFTVRKNSQDVQLGGVLNPQFTSGFISREGCLHYHPGNKQE